MTKCNLNQQLYFLRVPKSGAFVVTMEKRLPIFQRKTDWKTMIFFALQKTMLAIFGLVADMDDFFDTMGNLLLIFQKKCISNNKL
jgi:hypothetical protein